MSTDLTRGLAVARLVQVLAKAHGEGAGAVTYAYLAQQLGSDVKAVKRVVRKAGDWLAVGNSSIGRGAKAFIQLTDAGKRSAE